MRIIVELEKITLGFRKPYVFVESDLEGMLAEKGFSVPDSASAVLRLSLDGKQSPAFRWTRDEVEAYYEPTRSFVSVEGRNMEKIAEAFSEVSSALVKAHESVIENDLKWAELQTVVRIQGESSPLDVLGKTKDDGHCAAFGKILGKDLRPFSLTFYSADKSETGLPLQEIPNWVHIVIEPFVPNPSFYVLRLVYRQQDTNSVKEVADDLEDVVKALIEEVEK